MYAVCVRECLRVCVCDPSWLCCLCSLCRSLKRVMTRQWETHIPHLHTYTHTYLPTHTLSLALLRQAGGGENSAMTVSFLSITRVWATHIHTLILLLCGELPAWGIRPYLGHKDGVHILFVTYLTFTQTYTQIHTPEISYVMSEEWNTEWREDIEHLKEVTNTGPRPKKMPQMCWTDGGSYCLTPSSTGAVLYRILTVQRTILRKRVHLRHLESVLWSALQLSPWAVG